MTLGDELTPCRNTSVRCNWEAHVRTGAGRDSRAVTSGWLSGGYAERSYVYATRTTTAGCVFVTLTHGETGQNPTESDIVHLVHPREYGYGTDGRVSDGQRSDDRHADRRWLDGHVGRGPAGRRPDARFMLWRSHELGRAGPDTATAIRAGSI